MPCSRGWASLRLSISNDASHNEIWVVHDGAERNAEGIAEFTSLVNGARCTGIDVTADLKLEMALKSKTRNDKPGETAWRTETGDEFLEAIVVTSV